MKKNRSVLSKMNGFLENQKLPPTSPVFTSFLLTDIFYQSGQKKRGATQETRNAACLNSPV
jgi:hypothetical protein